MNTKEILKELCTATGVSGYEKEVAKIFAKNISMFVDEVKLDKMGSVIAKIEGTDSNAPRIMAYAHMDQLGFIVRRITDDGYIQVDRLGGIPEKILPALKLVIRNKKGNLIPGVFGNKAHHATSTEEKYKVDVVTSLYIDVGASSRKEVDSMDIDVGCPVTYAPEFFSLGEDKVCGTALDDRGGLMSLLIAAEKLKLNRPKNTTYLVGTVWEEFNIRGAVFAARTIKPDIAIGLDVILAGDTPDLADKYQNAVGKGPTINLYNFHGRGTLNGMIPNENLVNLAEEISEANDIPHQRFASLGIITESAYVQMECNGIACLDLGFPARYTHSPIEVVSLKDITNLGLLVSMLCQNIDETFSLERYTLE